MLAMHSQSLASRPLGSCATCNAERSRSLIVAKDAARERLSVTAAAAVPEQQAGPVAATASRPPTIASRRTLLALPLAAAATAAALPGTSQALPLAPLGRVGERVGTKRTRLSAEEVADILARDIGEGQYFVTGALTPEIFADDCRFADPTNDVVGLSRYMKALELLFDPAYSAVRLVGIKATGPATIEADWVMGGYLKFPWHPRVEAFQGHTVYQLNDEGLIQVQSQTWSKSAATALAESFTPTAGPREDIKQAVLGGNS